MAELRSRLDELIAGSIAKRLTRLNAIALLTAFSECLGPTLAEERDLSEPDVVLCLQHAAIGLLDQLIDALKDLDNGKVDDALKRSPTKPMPRLPSGSAKRINFGSTQW